MGNSPVAIPDPLVEIDKICEICLKICRKELENEFHLLRMRIASLQNSRQKGVINDSFYSQESAKIMDFYLQIINQK